MTTDITKKYNEVSDFVGITQDDNFDVIVVDPPWNQGKTGKRGCRPNQGTKLDYSTLSFEEIKLLPIKQWSKEDTFIFLWVTNSKDKKTKRPIIQMGFDLLETWGFTYNTFITWDKKTGPCPLSPFQIVTEHVIFGYKGKVNYNKESLGKIKTCFTETTKAHSIKPDSFYECIDQYFSGKKLDVFARKKRKGFQGWGDQYEIADDITTKDPEKNTTEKGKTYALF